MKIKFSNIEQKSHKTGGNRLPRGCHFDPLFDEAFSNDESLRKVADLNACKSLFNSLIKLSVFERLGQWSKSISESNEKWIKNSIEHVISFREFDPHSIASKCINIDIHAKTMRKKPFFCIP